MVKISKFHSLEKLKMKEKRSRFGVKVGLFCGKTELTLRFNVTYVDRQCKLSCSAT